MDITDSFIAFRKEDGEYETSGKIGRRDTITYRKENAAKKKKKRMENRKFPLTLAEGGGATNPMALYKLIYIFRDPTTTT